uniref:Uncharacterized protein n=1 Tax=viral metagenome TaxID=1070528 RepID=A0A6C0DSL3_9ZZZZ
MKNDLDISWMDEQERLEQINQNYYREPMNSIQCVFLFINNNHYIEKITNEKISLDFCLDNSMNRILKKETIVDLLKLRLENKYEVDDILLYNVIVEPNKIQLFSNSSENSSIKLSPFLKNVDMAYDIIVAPSIFIFHNVNAIYFLLKENPVEVFIPKSIIKSSVSKVKNTKKVRIIDHIDIAKQKKKNRNTRKITIL